MRIDARRFGSVAALIAALGGMGPQQKATLSRALGGGAAALAPTIRGMDPWAAVALFGPLELWLCVPDLEKEMEAVHRDWVRSLSLVVTVVGRAVTRLDEPAALLGAALGNSAALPRLRDGCEALRAARGRVANQTAPARGAAAKAAAMASAAAARARRGVAALVQGSGAGAGARLGRQAGGSGGDVDDVPALAAEGGLGGKIVPPAPGDGAGAQVQDFGKGTPGAA